MGREKRALIAGVLLAWCTSTAAVDLHRIWDDRCEHCHGHAGEFARHFLTVVDGTLYGRHPERDLRQFLGDHYLAGGEVEAVYAMLLAQAQTEGQFHQRCSACHGSAAEFVRTSLLLRDGAVHGRRSGQPVAAFLPGHAGLDESEAQFFTDLLTRIAGEVDAH